MTIIHVVRHGDVHNPQKIFYGRMPRFRLSELGQQQAAAAGEYLKDHPLAAIVSSPRLRARQTARAIANAHASANAQASAHGHNGLKIQQSKLIDEIHNPHQGRPIAELDAEGWVLYEDLPPGYETAAEVQARAVRLINRLRRQYPDQEVVMVSHGDIVLSTRFWVEGITFTDDAKNRVRLYPATASITTLTFDGSAAPTMTYHQPY
jgi:broad specificity phosphatase PhoE